MAESGPAKNLTARDQEIVVAALQNVKGGELTVSIISVSILPSSAALDSSCLPPLVLNIVTFPTDLLIDRLQRAGHNTWSQGFQISHRCLVCSSQEAFQQCQQDKIC